MTDELTERVSESIAKTQALLHDELVEELREQVKWRDKKEEVINEQLGAYKEYLLTLDPDMLCNIMDIWENDGRIFVTRPVEIQDIHDISLTHRGNNIFCELPGRPNVYPLFAIPKGKYRFVLIAVPVEDDV